MAGHLSTKGHSMNDIEKSKLWEEYDKTKNPQLREKIILEYNKNKIDEIIKNTKDKDLCVIIGSYKKDEILKRFSDCPYKIL